MARMNGIILTVGGIERTAVGIPPPSWVFLEASPGYPAYPNISKGPIIDIPDIPGYFEGRQTIIPDIPRCLKRTIPDILDIPGC